MLTLRNIDLILKCVKFGLILLQKHLFFLIFELVYHTLNRNMCTLNSIIDPFYFIFDDKGSRRDVTFCLKSKRTYRTEIYCFLVGCDIDTLSLKGSRSRLDLFPSLKQSHPNIPFILKSLLENKLRHNNLELSIRSFGILVSTRPILMLFPLIESAQSTQCFLAAFEIAG